MEHEIQESAIELRKNFEKEYPGFVSTNIEFEEHNHVYRIDEKIIPFSVSDLVKNVKPAFETVATFATPRTANKIVKLHNQYQNEMYTTIPFLNAPVSNFVLDQAHINDANMTKSFLAYLISQRHIGDKLENDCDQLYAYMLGTTIYLKTDSNPDVYKDEIITMRKTLLDGKTRPIVCYEYTFYNFKNVDEKYSPELAVTNINKNGITRRVYKKEQKNIQLSRTIKGPQNANDIINAEDIQIFIKLHWREASFQGTLMHERIEFYLNNSRKYKKTSMKPEFKNISLETKNIISWIFKMWVDNPQLVPFLTECSVYLKETQKNPDLAGSIDYIAINDKKKQFAIFDWKRSKNVFKEKSPQVYYHKCIPTSTMGNYNVDNKITFVKCDKGNVCNKGCLNPNHNQSFGSTDLEFYFLQLGLYERMFRDNFINNSSGYFKEFRVNSINIVTVSPISQVISHYELVCKIGAEIAGVDKPFISWEIIQERVDAALYIGKSIPKEKSKR